MRPTGRREEGRPRLPLSPSLSALWRRDSGGGGTAEDDDGGTSGRAGLRAGDAKASARVKQTRLAWNKGGGVLSAVPVLQNILAYNTSSQICLNIAKFHYPNCNQHDNLATLRVRVSGGCKAKVRRWGRTDEPGNRKREFAPRSLARSRYSCSLRQTDWTAFRSVGGASAATAARKAEQDKYR